MLSSFWWQRPWPSATLIYVYCCITCCAFCNTYQPLVTAFVPLVSIQNVVSRTQSHHFAARIQIPKSAKERDNLAIRCIQAAIRSPRIPSFRCIECEFPPLAKLNQINDGSLQSSRQVDAVHAQFVQQLVMKLSPLWGPRPRLLLGAAAPSAAAIRTAGRSVTVTALNNNNNDMVAVKGREICVLLTPSVRRDYQVAQQLALQGNTVVLVNGLAKDTTSVAPEATMAFYYKPLTYNSQVAGYLLRCFPQPWTVVNAAGTALATFRDEEILVPGTNTPDLRASVRIVQRAADLDAMQQRRSKV